MALQAKVNNIAAPASAGDVDSVSLGFDPKAVLAFYGQQTATGGAVDAHIGVGFSGTASEDISYYLNSDNGTASSDAVRSILTNAFLKSTLAGAATARVTATNTMGTDKFTVNFSATVSGVKHPYLALGGTDITNAVAGTIASTTTTADVVVNTLGFQPDVIFFAAQNITTTGTANNHSSFTFGVAKSTTERWAAGIKVQNSAAAANTARGFYNNKVLFICSTTIDATVDEWDLKSMDSGGFTLTHPTASGSAYLLGYLAIKGGQWAVGNFTQPTSTGTAAAVSGLSFQPAGILLASASYETANAITPTARLAIGAASSTTARESIWVGDEDAADPMKNDSYYSTTKVLSLLDETGDGSPTLLFDADLSSLDSGGFSLNTSTADSTARLIGYVAFGSAGAANPAPSVNDTVTITEDLTIRVNMHPSVSDTVTITENVNPSYSLPSPIVDTVTITESVTALVVLNISIFDSVTVTEDVTIRVNMHPSVFDTVTVTEDVTLVIPILYISAVETVTITEAITLSIPLPVSVFDTVTITENVAVTVVNTAAITFSVFDTVTVSEALVYDPDEVYVSEFVQIVVVDNHAPSVFDTVTVTEAVTVSIQVTPSVSDLVTITESVTVVIPTIVPSVFDTVTITEAITLSIPLPASVFDEVTVTEAITLSIPLPVSVFDSVTVTEAITLSIPLPVSVFDTVTVTEAITLSIPLPVSVFDTATITEDIVLSIPLPVSVFDTVTVTEEVTAYTPTRLLSVFDNITVTEVFTSDLRSHPLVFDTVTLTEDITMAVVTGDPNTKTFLVYDTVTVSEALVYDPDEVYVSEYIEMSVPLPPSTFDLTTLSEAITLLIPTMVFAPFDTVTVTEFLSLSGVLSVSVSETVTVSEDITAAVVAVFPSTDDTVTVSEAVTMALYSQSSLFDLVTVSEDVTIVIPVLFVSISELVTVTDTPDIDQVFLVNVSENLTVSESVVTQIIVSISLSDSVTVSETVTFGDQPETTAPSLESASPLGSLDRSTGQLVGGSSVIIGSPYGSYVQDPFAIGGGSYLESGYSSAGSALPGTVVTPSGGVS